MVDSPKPDGDGNDNNQSPVAPEQEQGEGDMEPSSAAQDPSIYETEVKEQDRWLPIANVARIMKTALPDNAKIAKEAKECMQECVSEFISFITSEASEKCQQEKRKTVNGEDILFAMTSLGFENYSEALKIYLSRFREVNISRQEQHQRPSSGYDTSAATGDTTIDGATQAAVAGGVAGGPVPTDSTFGGRPMTTDSPQALAGANASATNGNPVTAQGFAAAGPPGVAVGENGYGYAHARAEEY